MDKINKQYNIISVSKADLLGLEKQNKNGEVVPRFSKSKVMKLTDSQMERLASKLANDYCEQLYWSSLEILGDYIINEK